MFTILYVAVGVLCAALSDRTLCRLRAQASERILSAALCLGLWPLWAPIALTRKASEPTTLLAPELSDARDALDDARAAVRGTPLEALLTDDIAHSILAELEQLVERQSELRRLIGRTAGFKRTSTSDRDGVARIAALAERDARRIAELIELVGALRTRLVLARYSGASIEGVGDLSTELTTRVESLDEPFSPAWRLPTSAADSPEGRDTTGPARESVGVPV